MSAGEIIELIGLVMTGIGLIGSLIAWIKEVKEKHFKELVEKKMEEAEQLALSNVEKKLWVIKEVGLELHNLSKDLQEKVASYIEECIDFKNKLTGKK